MYVSHVNLSSCKLTSQGVWIPFLLLVLWIQIKEENVSVSVCVCVCLVLVFPRLWGPCWDIWISIRKESYRMIINHTEFFFLKI